MVKKQDNQNLEVKKHEITNLKDYEQENIIILKNYIKNVHNVDNIDKYTEEQLYNIIMNAQYKGVEYSPSWKKLKLFSLASYYKFNNEEKKSDYFLKKGKEINKKINNVEEQQKQTDKEKDNYINYFELKNILEKTKNYKNLDDHYKYLILACLCTDQEPERPQIYTTLKYIKELKDAKNENENYIYISKTGRSGKFIINVDKVDEHEQHQQKKNIRLNNEFRKIVVESFNKYPRPYLFNFDVVKKGDKLLRLLQDTITDNGVNKKFNFQIARSSFINYKFLENPDMTYAQKKTLALNMRHSKETQEKHYLKTALNITNKTLIEMKKEINDDYKELKNIENKINNNLIIVNKLKANTNNIQPQNFTLDYKNEDDKKKLLLYDTQIKAKKIIYDEYLTQTQNIINKYNEQYTPIKNFIDVNKYLLNGNYDHDNIKLTLLGKILQEHKYFNKDKKITDVFNYVLYDGYDKDKLNEQIKKILNDEYDESYILANEIKNTEKENKKRRNELIFHANKNREKAEKETEKKGWKKIKGVISPANIQKYNIVYNEETKRYE